MIVTLEAVRAVMDAHPLLTDEGYGHPNRGRVTPAERAEAHRRNRDALATDWTVAAVQGSVDWLATLTPRKTATDGPSSYGLKHIMERATGTYVTNGAFITAALLLELPVLLDDLNPAIGVTRRSVEAALKTNR